MHDPEPQTPKRAGGAPSFSLVIPAYNEEGAIGDIARRALRTLRAVTDDYELLILDDCSRDRTWEIMQEVRNEDPAHVRLLRHEVNGGIAKTIEDLYAACTKDFIFITAGDGQYPVESLERIVPMLDRCDIVSCVRVNKHYTLPRRVISGAFRVLPMVLFGMDLRDPGSTKCMRREIIQTIPLWSTSVFTEAERVIRARKRGYRLGWVPIEQGKRKSGKASGANMKLVRAALKDMLTTWWRVMILRRY